MYRWLFMCLFLCYGTLAKGQIHSDTLTFYHHRLHENISVPERFNLQLGLAQYYLYLSQRDKKYTDSAWLWYDQSSRIANHFHVRAWVDKCLEFKGLYAFETGDSYEGENCFDQTINSRKLKTKKEIAHAWAALAGNIPVWNPRLADAKAMCHLKEEAIYLSLNDKLYSALALKDVADAHLNGGQLQLAESELMQVLKELRAIHYANLHHTYYLLSAVYNLKGDIKKELYYCLETIKSMEATRDTGSANLFYFKLANVYEDLGMNDNSIKFYKKAFISPDWTYNCLQHIVLLLIRENKKDEAFAFLKQFLAAKHLPANFEAECKGYQALADCYIALKQNANAEKYVLKMVKAAENIYSLRWDAKEYRVLAYSTGIEFYLQTGQYTKAAKYVHQLLAEQKNLVNPVLLCKTELFNFKIDSASGNYLAAIKHFQLHKQLSDSLFNATKSKQIEDLQINYETGQKDKNLQLLKKQSQLQQLNLKKKDTVTNLVIVCLVLTLILLAVSYNRYKHNRRNNLQLQANQYEISEKNTWLEKLLRDNEWLLREVHHRVKNNLHVIMGLLQSQSAYLKDKVALEAVRDSRHRVQTMSLIHQKLYTTQNVTEVYMPEYITELVDYLKDSFETQLKIYFQLEIEPIVLDAGFVVPVGLILNEVITNAIKYAFPYSDNDTISIRFFRSAVDEVTLIIADNGCGLPAHFNIDDLKSFGMLLVKGLATELNGAFKLESTRGTAITIVFNVARQTPSY